ncbi:DUF6993 domain-containing protein [Curtobacterium sp. RRHDQ10]|uniref:DUF6993 domain-containing protein n=1 Tax=Curtobacterium phyllosphaerae TaxID=3413379 RepID=UPI003BF26A82
MRARAPFALAGATVAVLVLASCTAGGGVDRDTVSAPASDSATSSAGPTSGGTSSSVPSSEAATTASATPAPEVAAARTKFDATNQATATANADAGDTAIVAALVAAGFDVHAMQITPDTTSIGRRADAIQVSVLVGSTCLLGQFRGATYVGDTAPVLGTGKCLIGTTQAIGG